MKHICLGGLDVSRIGLGAMTMAGTYTSGGGLDDAESIRTVHRALELGVTHIDTAEIYGPFHSEEIVGRAIKDRRDQVVVATKFGLVSRRRPTRRRRQQPHQHPCRGRRLVDPAIIDAIQRIAEAPRVSMAQVALAWVLKNPVVDAPIVGVTKQHHLVDAAALDLEPTNDEVTALEEPSVLRQAAWF